MGKNGLSWRSCFSCYGKVRDSPSPGSDEKGANRQKSLRGRSPQQLSSSDLSNVTSLFSPEDLSLSLAGSNIYSFTLAELKTVTQNFSTSHLIGEGGFGQVYKGYVDDKLRPGLKAQPVAVKLMDQDGLQGHREWLVSFATGAHPQYGKGFSIMFIPHPSSPSVQAEVIFLGQLRHKHLVKLIGYCCEDENRLLVYEFMARGSLENHLFRSKLRRLKRRPKPAEFAAQ